MLEPACGEAEFLVAAFRRFESIGVSSRQAAAQIVGCELHDKSADAARRRCASLYSEPTIEVGDFLKKRPRDEFDAVIGNPPYVRFQLLGGSQRDAIREVSYRSGLAMSAMASAWAPFVIQSAAFLKRGGRLGLVLPAELLAVNYAAPVRSFLLSSFAEITLVSFDDQVFPGVQEEVVLLLARGYREGFTDCLSWVQCSGVSDMLETEPKLFRPSSSESRWTSGLTTDVTEGALRELERAGMLCPLSEWGSVSLGSVTGNNGYFILSRNDVETWGLGASDVRRVSPPGSRHLRRLSLSEENLDELERRGMRTYLFYPEPEPSDEAWRYIDYGVDCGVDRGYKCRKRNPWWKVPLSLKPDVFLTYMNDYMPNLCANEGRVECVNSAHGLVFSDRLRALGNALLPLACLNSATSLHSELVGRAYGGGVLKLEPREAGRLLVPSPLALSEASSALEDVKGLVAACESGREADAARLVDEVFARSFPDADDAWVETMRSEKERLYARRRARRKRG